MIYILKEQEIMGTKSRSEIEKRTHEIDKLVLANGTSRDDENPRKDH